VKAVEAPCPSCGGTVEFKVSSSLVTVCEFCQSVVARGDRKLEDRGKVAAIVETDTPLHLGMRGKHRGHEYELIGRVQYQHEAGGVWNEWYASFTNGHWGWLAESQGQFHITFERKLAPKALAAFPKLDDLEVGRKFSFPKVGEFTVGEIGEAQCVSAEGEVPFQFVPNESHRFADLHGDEGRYATFDYSGEQAAVFIGQEVTLAEIGVGEDVVDPEAAPREITAAGAVACPQCGGSMELRAPDKSLRVCCPFCNALLDAEHGTLKYLTTLSMEKHDPLIPLGKTCKLDDVEYTVIGFMRRSTKEDKKKYFWQEYLLYQPRIGFRWLVHSDSHWNFVEPISPGEVSAKDLRATHKGKDYRLFAKGLGTVEYVLGEFYWKVAIGQTVLMADYVAAPYMLSVERSGSTGRGEVHWSRGRYLTVDEVEELFAVESLPRTFAVGPNQPFPIGNLVFGMWAAFVGLLFVIDLIFVSFKPKVDQFLFFLALVAVSAVPIGTLIYRFSFEKSRWEDSQYSPFTS
jgi:hypothetical protein